MFIVTGFYAEVVMQMSKVNYFFISISLVLGLFNNVYAECTFNPESTVQNTLNFTIPLKTQKMTLGTELPLASFYIDWFDPIPAAPVIIDCTEPLSEYEVIHKRLTSSLALADDSHINFAGGVAGKMRETGVPGIGVLVISSIGGQHAFPSEFDQVYCGPVSTQCVIDSQHMHRLDFALQLYKLGPTSSGIINGSDLPCIEQSIASGASQLTITRACFTGSMVITAETCNIMQPDIIVNMGRHVIADNLSDMPLVKFNIDFANCPQFHGRRFTNFHHDLDSYVTTKNRFEYSFMPMTSIIDASNGIIAIDDTLVDSASGVGIQIFYYSDQFDKYDNVSFDRINYDIIEDEIKLGLAAKYVLTGPIDEVTPGKANAKVVFTINYL